LRLLWKGNLDYCICVGFIIILCGTQIVEQVKQFLQKENLLVLRLRLIAKYNTYMVGTHKKKTIILYANEHGKNHWSLIIWMFDVVL